MKIKTYIFWAIFIAIFVIAGFFVVKKMKTPAGINQPRIIFSQDSSTNNQVPSNDVQKPKDNGQEQSQTVDPLPDALSRITKKPFGIFITPKTSPVQPERFAGYHNAVDLEITPEQQNVDVPVKALCDGKLLVARTASGYGGVAVQSCTLDGQTVTIIYGHINSTSVTAKVGDQLKAGDFLANLGKGFSSQADGERKHLHLGIHKGISVNILGYVQSKDELSDWIDPTKYLQ